MDPNNSLVIIDKPPGLTSHEVTTLVKKITGAARSGHAGTLDPQVSGVLPVALGRATKLLKYISAKDKTYVGIIKFRKRLSKNLIESLFSQFSGEIIQTPPKLSAVRKVPRKRRVFHLKLLEKKERLALFEARVSAGTYIRTLCQDIGKKCGGARMEELRRIKVGKISETEAHTLPELKDAVWFSQNGQGKMLESMLKRPESFIDFPRVFIKESSLRSVLSGAQIMAPAVESIEDVEKGGYVAIYCGSRFIGVGISNFEKDMLKGIAVRLERIHKD